MQLALERSDLDISEQYSSVLAATPTESGLPRRFHFSSLAEAIDYAAKGNSGMNFYGGRLELTKVLPYRTLREMALVLARALHGAGLKRADRVALIADTDPDFVVAFAACQYGGLIPAPMPLPSAFGGRESYVALLRHMLKCAHASAAVAPEWVLPYLTEAAEGLDLKLCGTVPQLSALPQAPVDFSPAAPDELSYLQFSSGSTRMPAGIAVTHSAVMSNTAAIAEIGLAVHDGDRAVSWLPFYHDMGLVGFLLATLVSQLSVDFIATRDFARRPFNWLRLIGMNGGSISYSSSFGYDLCAKRASNGVFPDADLSTWRAAGIGGDMIRPSVLDTFARTFAKIGFRKEAFLPSYGLAETTLAVSFCELGRGLRLDRVDTEKLENACVAEPAVNGGARARDFVRCGRVIPGHRVEIRGEDGNVLGEREVGHVLVHGPSLMKGYDGRPEDTAKIIDAEGWLDTGDLGYFVGEELVITGRSKEIIIVNGRNLWPQDLEYTAEKVEGIRHGDTAAFSVEDAETGEEQVVMLVQCRNPDEAVRQRLVHAVVSELRKVHGIGARVVLVPKNALPMTSSGKLKRRGARASYLAGDFSLKAAQ